MITGRQSCSDGKGIGADGRPDRTCACPGSWTQSPRWRHGRTPNTLFEQRKPAYHAGGGSSWGTAPVGVAPVRADVGQRGAGGQRQQSYGGAGHRGAPSAAG
eukprot:462193-Pleurochrysis_carterae.AAC.2